MRKLLVAALALMPGIAFAGGYPSVAGGYPSVEVPCYPADRYELCALPVPQGHSAGYLPPAVPTRARLYAGRGGFSILVAPNVVPYDVAVRDAARAAAIHCGQEPGERIVARIDRRERYAPEALEAWKFGGRCQ